MRQYRSRLRALQVAALIFISACLADERPIARERPFEHDAGTLVSGDDEDGGAELPGGLAMSTPPKGRVGVLARAAPGLSSTKPGSGEVVGVGAPFAAALGEPHGATTHVEGVTHAEEKRVAITYLKPSTNAAHASFGGTMAASGDTIVVGTTHRYDNAGAAYVFVRGPAGFRQEAELRASNADSGDAFGWAVAISGDTIVVGAGRERSHAREVNGDPSSNDSKDSGAAYVFSRSAGVWKQQAYLKASGPAGGECFGCAVAVHGNTIAVGAFFDWSGVAGDPWDRSRPGSGAVYVFTREGEDWSQQAYLKADKPCNRVHLGRRLAMSEDTLVASAWNEQGCAEHAHGATLDPNAMARGAVYVFRRVAGAWMQEAHLTASNADYRDRFGEDIAISGDVIAVGAPNEDSTSGSSPESNALADSGAVYLFARTSAGWRETAFLKASNADDGDYFGDELDFDGNTLAVGAWREASGAHGVDGDRSDDSAPESGAVYLFRGDGGWSERAYLKAPNAERKDCFGMSIAVLSNAVVVGATGEDSGAMTIDGDAADNGLPASGAAYVFTTPD